MSPANAPSSKASRIVILTYAPTSFERAQYKDLRDEWEAHPEAGHKTPCDTYGAEHFSRLLGKQAAHQRAARLLTPAPVTLPELIAQTNMDQQSVNRLREELTILTNWLTKHAARYFVSEYETPSQEYIDKARSV